MAGRRRHQRARMPLLVQYRAAPGENFRTDYSADLSRGGVFLHTGEPAPVGTTVELLLTPRDGTRLVRCRGRVVRCSLSGEGDDARVGMAVEFVGLDDDDARFLDEMVRAHIERQAHPTLRARRRRRPHRS